MSTWNYRVLAFEYKEDTYLRIHEVYYDTYGVPDGYSESPSQIGGENTDEVKLNVELVNMALNKPILFGGDKFPQEYKIKKIT